jgi:hypothetical protein
MTHVSKRTLQQPALLGLISIVLGLLWGCGSSSSGFPVDGGPGGSGGTCTGTNCATGGNGGASGQCASVADCADRTDGKTACDIASGSCVGCVVSSQCGAGMECVANTCQAVATCTNSLDCPGGQVCDVINQRCVVCISSLECASSEICLSNTCRRACTSSTDCVRLGQSCNLALGVCVECVLPSDCAGTEHCGQGLCTPDLCAQGTSTCVANARVTCNSDGSGTLTPVPCGTNQACQRVGSDTTCVAALCTPSSRACETTSERVLQCSADGMSQQVAEDCSATGQVCVAGDCQTVVCAANTLFCSGAEVRRCSPEGESSSVVTNCPTGQYCNPATAACATLLCPPSGPACNGDIATTCNADGTGYIAGGIDCASSALRCFDGECRDQLCSPSTLFCSAGSVQQCSSDGLSSALYQTCSSAQYCDAAAATCRALVCTPNQPACNGNLVTTCNADGSGFVAGGTSCGALYCVSGTCQTALFAEDFEDGDYVGWTTGTDTGITRSVTTALAAGGLRSLEQTGGSTHQQGLYRTFTAVTPANISWWAMATTTASYSGYFILTSGGYSNYIWYSYFNTGGSISTSGSPTTPYVANQWYHFEMRNINWTSHTFDWYINDALIQAS